VIENRHTHISLARGLLDLEEVKSRLSQPSSSDFLHGAANAAEHRVSVVESVVGLEDAREKRQKA
jgi:hypothetical protein